MSETLGERLKYSLKIRRISQKRFSAWLEISEAEMSRIINDKQQPKADMIVEICRKLGISSDWLLGLM